MKTTNATQRKHVSASPSVGFPVRSSSHITKCSIEKYWLKLHPVTHIINNYITNNHIQYHS